MQISLNELKRRVGRAYSALSCCRLCPRNCAVNRLRNELGVCHTGKVAKVASHNIHTGEEPPISGTRGSGTIFFSSCNLKCKFCQNYPISQLGHGNPAAPRTLAGMMIALQKRGAHNINIVTGSHVVPQILAGIYVAKKGCHSRFNLPIVWNSSGYDGLESLKLLDGVVDIYMPDIKYSSNDVAEHYSAATNYWDIVRPVIKEMHRQVGDLEIGKNGLAAKGLIIRHLLLPEGGEGTEKVLKFISEEISNKTYISLMSQYFPTHKAVGHPVLGRQITKQEWKAAEKMLQKYGLENGWVQA
ncbi:MAG: 4Fe-4S cluster-binding domain-containing protein [Deltaproteobacteria bacterium]|nr:4Fe-4S cluster-binding domain-containing protein [Deltaproteobacteria bacterium]